jgi:hypothetical protein
MFYYTNTITKFGAARARVELVDLQASKWGHKYSDGGEDHPNAWVDVKCCQRYKYNSHDIDIISNFIHKLAHLIGLACRKNAYT